MFAYIINVCIRDLGNMYHSCTAAVDINESSVLCDTLYLAIVDLSNFQLHINL